jgi:uncharacterized glyoxalase superfamily protein PhnB
MVTLHRYYSYENAASAIDWLAKALSFTTVARQDADNGSVIHAELKLGEAVIMVASSDESYDMPAPKGQSTGQGTYLFVSDQELDVAFARVEASDAQIIYPTETTEWGTKRFRFLDPWGYEWTLGTYQPGQSW